MNKQQNEIIMKGSILEYSIQNQTGIILTDTQQQYSFNSINWFEKHAPVIGEQVHFELNEQGSITQITRLQLPQNEHFSDTPITQDTISNLNQEEAHYTMFNWFMKSLKNYANFTGRARRKEFWFFSFVYMIIYIGLFLIEFNLWAYPILTLLFVFAMIIPSLAVQIRRLHDINKSGWSICVGFIPFVGGIILLIWLCTETTPEDNQWGKPAK